MHYDHYKVAQIQNFDPSRAPMPWATRVLYADQAYRDTDQDA